MSSKQIHILEIPATTSKKRKAKVNAYPIRVTPVEKVSMLANSSKLLDLINLKKVKIKVKKTVEVSSSLKTDQNIRVKIVICRHVY